MSGHELDRGDFDDIADIVQIPRSFFEPRKNPLVIDVLLVEFRQSKPAFPGRLGVVCASTKGEPNGRSAVLAAGWFVQ